MPVEAQENTFLFSRPSRKGRARSLSDRLQGQFSPNGPIRSGGGVERQRILPFSIRTDSPLPRSSSLPCVGFPLDRLPCFFLHRGRGSATQIDGGVRRPPQLRPVSDSPPPRPLHPTPAPPTGGFSDTVEEARASELRSRSPSARSRHGVAEGERRLHATEASLQRRRCRTRQDARPFLPRFQTSLALPFPPPIQPFGSVSPLMQLNYFRYSSRRFFC